MGNRFVVIGAGNGGQSLAGDIVIRGGRVASIYDINPAPINDIRTRGGILMSGPVQRGFAPIPHATNNLAEAVERADVLLVTTTANSHKELATSIATHINPRQAILLIPGYVGSSVLFAKTLLACGAGHLPLIGEALSFPYATRLVEPAHAGIKARKNRLPIAALPATRNQELLGIIKEAIPECELSADSLSVGFNNPNPVNHIPYYLFNLGKVEGPQDGSVDFHKWGTKTTFRLSHQLDVERLRVMEAMGLETLSFEEFEKLAYNGRHYTPLPQNAGSIATNALQAPDRFVDEDVPMGLVPVAEFGDLVNVDTPVTDVMIKIADLVRERDFHKEGRTMEYMGLADMGVEDILEFVRRGTSR